MRHGQRDKRNREADGKNKGCAVGSRQMARLLVVDPVVPDAGAIREAVRVLRAGGLVALPTETVYGLGARALDERAVARVFDAKRRPVHHPLIAHVLCESEAAELASVWPDAAAALASAFWPGPLTIVVDRRPHVPAAIAGGGDSIAVRVPSHPVARAVIAALGEPVAAPSANRYQGLSPTSAEHVMKELGDVVDLVLDAGPCDAGIESTVVDARALPLRVLRPGVVSLSALRAVAAEVEDGAARLPDGAPRISPGMDARHYAPRATLLIATTGRQAERIAQEVASVGQLAAIVTHEPQELTLGRQGPLVRTLPNDPVEYGRLLYRTLHSLDNAGVDLIVVRRVPDDEGWCAIADRLERASG
jgi:L-threonylcarbamoyladenylate synthase